MSSVLCEAATWAPSEMVEISAGSGWSWYTSRAAVFPRAVAENVLASVAATIIIHTVAPTSLRIEARAAASSGDPRYTSRWMQLAVPQTQALASTSRSGALMESDEQLPSKWALTFSSACTGTITSAVGAMTTSGGEICISALDPLFKSSTARSLRAPGGGQLQVRIAVESAIGGRVVEFGGLVVHACGYNVRAEGPLPVEAPLPQSSPLPSERLPSPTAYDAYGRGVWLESVLDIYTDVLAAGWEDWSWGCGRGRTIEDAGYSFLRRGVAYVAENCGARAGVKFHATSPAARSALSTALSMPLLFGAWVRAQDSEDILLSIRASFHPNESYDAMYAIASTMIQVNEDQRATRSWSLIVTPTPSGVESWGIDGFSFLFGTAAPRGDVLFGGVALMVDIDEA